jgi:hypothetical protein
LYSDDPEQDEDDENWDAGPAPLCSKSMDLHPLLIKDSDDTVSLPAQGEITLSEKKSIIRSYVTAAYRVDTSLPASIIY